MPLPPPKCSTCDADATHEILDADPEKGNLACDGCLYRFWRIMRSRRLS